MEGGELYGVCENCWEWEGSEKQNGGGVRIVKKNQKGVG